MTISILILAKNEEQDLPGCLASVSFSDDIVIYDSYSTDKTAIIAERFGARLIRRPGQDLSKAYGGNEAYHRTWGLRNIKYKYPWLFVIDADERLSEAAVVEMLAIANQVNIGPVAYRIRRRDFLQSRWLRHVQVTPWYIRFFRPEYVHYQRVINPVTVVDGLTGDLASYLDHYPFSKGMSHWLARHNTYSTFEAEQIIANRLQGESFSVRKAFLTRDFNQRRYHQKELFYRLPLRPVLKFLILYIVKCGFLDGRPGLTYALLQSIYEYLILLKTEELEMQLPEKKS